MSNLKIAVRYAEALMKTAEAENILKKVSSDLEAVKNAIKDSHEFNRFLKSPVIKKEKKQQVVESVFGKSVEPLTLQFLNLLIDKGREDIALSVIDVFFKLQDEVLGIMTVQVRSAAELTEQQKSQLEQSFAAYTNKKIRIVKEIDKQLIGGFVAQVGDTMFDGSVKRQLELLRERFAEESVE